ncbi:MAG: hypothetical protein A2Y17_01765 [Clostridiales bacterium GWF2_38_85]|nr:MAG: hypothetical protein A2Y17_01765 [Clostridiales bacterium GWF2_38_85]HBL84763.1 hypothetical protein [Clostridiales bacterium]
MSKLKLPLFLFVLIFIFSSCEKPLYHDFIGEKNSYKITVPYSWHEIDELNENADLCLGDSKQSQFLVIILDYKEDFEMNFSIEDYFALSRDSILASNNGSLLISGDEDALNFIISGVSDGVKVCFYVSIKEDMNNFYQLVFWTTERQFYETEIVFQNITDSFIELD